MKSIGDNLKLYRIRSKMSLTEAGKVAGLSAPGLMKYEKNLINPSLEKLSLLAKAYGVSLDDILNVREGSTISFKNFYVDNKVSEARCAKIKSLIKQKIDNYFDLLDKSGIKLVNKFGVHVINSHIDAASLATKLRIFFQLPIDTPISNLIHLLENHDIIIITLENNEITSGFIGFYENINNVPVIVVPKMGNGYDQRFKVAKFLGELLIITEGDKDKFTDAFALSLLIPKGGLIKEFDDTRTRISLNEIVVFSKIYRVSYKNIIRCLEGYGVITRSCAKYLNIDINKEELKEQIFMEEALNYEKMLYKLYSKEIISDINPYL